MRPLKVKLRSQVKVKGIINISRNWQEFKKSKKVRIRRDVNQEEINKLKELLLSDIRNNKYRICKSEKNKKLRIGVMMLVKTVGVEKVETGEGMAEVINIKLNMKGKKERDIAVCYVPTNQEHGLKRNIREWCKTQLIFCRD